MNENEWFKSNALKMRRFENRKRKAGRRRLLALICMCLLIVVVCGTAMVLAKDVEQEPENGTDVTGFDTPTPSVTPIPTDSASDNNEAAAEDVTPTPEVMAVAAGPFGILEPTATPTPYIDIPEDEEIWMADFVDTREPVNAKGIYVTAEVAKSSSLDDIIALIDRTELNTVVIDIKADTGYIVYSMDSETAKAIGATTNEISNVSALMAKLKEHNIYAVARVVAFKDPLLAKNRPDLAVYNSDGSYYVDNQGTKWVSPYKQEVWEYLAEVGIQCAAIGFNEINFDYIRFPTDGVSNVVYDETGTTTKEEAITAFVKYICETLRPYGIYVSADVYATVINSTVDAAAVGQDYASMSRYLDYICPMIYPSHYGYGYGGIDYPDMEPYTIIKWAVQASDKKIASIPSYQHHAIVRPWLQDFTATYLTHHMVYDAEAVRTEITALYDNGVTEWLLWNAAVVYTEDALYDE